MYRCLECNAVYNVKPDYCECGNDTFEEAVTSASPQYQQMQLQPQVQPQQQQYYQEQQVAQVKPKKPMTTQEMISKAIFAICIILSIFAWVFIGKDSASVKKPPVTYDETGNVVSVKIPNINEVWDSTPPAAQKQIGVKAPAAPQNIAVLNARMSTLSKEMTTYVVSLGQTFVASWARGAVVGDGSCEIEFRIDTNGKIKDKKILKASNNTSMDDSVKLMLENVTQVNPPPSDYKGERIVMAFSIQNRAFKVFYPQY